MQTSLEQAENEYARSGWNAPLRRGLHWLVLFASALVSAVVGVALVATMLGQDVFVITGGSMNPSVPPGSLVIAERVHVESLSPGDIITFRRASAPDSPVTHRVTSIDHTRGTIEVWTKGDANATVDPEPITGDHLVSRTRLMLPMAGYVMASTRTTAGQVILIGLPLAYLAVRVLRDSARDGSAIDTRAERASSPRESRRGLNRAVMSSVSGARFDAAWRNLRSALRRTIARGAYQTSAANDPGGQGAPAADPDSFAPPRLRHLAALFRPIPPMPESVSDRAQAPMQTIAALARELKDREHEFEVAMTRSLQPLVEYADRLGASLVALESRLPTDAPLLQVFDAQITTERERLASVRDAIEHAKAPLRALLAREAGVLDAVMAPFDDEIAGMEELQREQRRHLVRVVAGLDSEEFRLAVGLVSERVQRLKILANSGETDPREVLATLESNRGEVRAGNAYLANALASLSAEPNVDPDPDVRLSAVA